MGLQKILSNICHFYSIVHQSAKYITFTVQVFSTIGFTQSGYTHDSTKTNYLTDTAKLAQYQC